MASFAVSITIDDRKLVSLAQPSTLRAALQVKSCMQFRAPVDTGRLVRSIGLRAQRPARTNHTVEYTVTTGLPGRKSSPPGYAVYADAHSPFIQPCMSRAFD